MIRKIRKNLNRLAENYYTRLLLKRIKPIDIKDSEYLFIFNQMASKFTAKLYMIVSHELSKAGLASCFQYKNGQWSEYYPRLIIDENEISNSFFSVNRFYIETLREQRLFFKWSLDIENQKIEAEGINFFPVIQNTLRTIQKRYNISANDQNNREVYNKLIHTCDLLLKHFYFLKNYSKTTRKKIRLVVFETDYVPNGVLWMLCDRFSQNRDIECIELRRGYINYFGQHHPKASYVACSNLTKMQAETCLAISRQEWSEFAGENIDLDNLFKPVSNALGKNFSPETPSNQKKIIGAIEDFKSRGKKVFVLFSHLFYDTPVHDTSPAFNGMCDWIVETVRYFSSKEDLLLLKPHPAEFEKDQPQKAPNETLASFLSNTELPENILLLEHHQFTIKDLSPFISCGLIWRSSVAMELIFLGIPCLIAGNPIYRVLDLHYAKDRDHYFYMIEQSHRIKTTEQHKRDVATYLYMLERKHVHIDCISYTKLRKFHWKRKALRRYLTNGNENIKSVADSMLS